LNCAKSSGKRSPQLEFWHCINQMLGVNFIAG